MQLLRLLHLLQALRLQAVTEPTHQSQLKLLLAFLLVVERTRPLVALHHSCTKPESMAGQPAYIVNISGASGQKGAKQVLGEKADGHTLYMINIGTFIVGELAKVQTLHTV